MAAGKKKIKGNEPYKISMRESAEKIMKETKATPPAGLSGQTTEHLIHELWVHQVELETQADELRKTQLIL